jgi:hypothetical protein
VLGQLLQKSLLNHFSSAPKVTEKYPTNVFILCTSDATVTKSCSFITNVL